MKNFNLTTFIWALLIVSALTGACFFAAAANDEGMLSTNSGWMVFSTLFDIFRFPTHILSWDFFSHGGGTLFMLGLLINCVFYALIIERVTSFLKRQ